MEGNEVALSRKPKAERTGLNPSEADISALIEKGGAVPARKEKGRREVGHFWYGLIPVYSNRSILPFGGIRL